MVDAVCDVAGVRFGRLDASVVGVVRVADADAANPLVGLVVAARSALTFAQRRGFGRHSGSTHL